MNTDGSGAGAPLVSVVVPTFNRTRFLPEALASAVAQTYAAIEIIVADDASSEDVRATVLSRFSDPRIRYQRNPRNLGMGANCWTALSRASGKYVATLHDDDMWGPDFLASLVPALEVDESLSVAFCDHQIVDEGGVLDAAATEANTRLWHRDRLAPGTLRPFAEAAVVWQAVPAAMAALFRKSAIDWADFPPEVGTYYDVWLGYQAARTGAGAHYEPRRLTRYRVHGQSETRSWTSAAGHLKAMRQAEFVFGRYLEDPALESLRAVLGGLYARKAISLAGALIDGGATDEARRILRAAHRRTPRAELKAALLLALLPSRASRGLMSTARRLRNLVATVPLDMFKSIP
jgi:glycosyltransferase involved in cell wall biosynthesis